MNSLPSAYDSFNIFILRIIPIYLIISFVSRYFISKRFYIHNQYRLNVVSTMIPSFFAFVLVVISYSINVFELRTSTEHIHWSILLSIFCFAALITSFIAYLIMKFLLYAISVGWKRALILFVLVGTIGFILYPKRIMLYDKKDLYSITMTTCECHGMHTKDICIGLTFNCSTKPIQLKTIIKK
ncbi:hypothetical protein BH09PAT2_BH09PAT2_09720 [soil metagenome]